MGLGRIGLAMVAVAFRWVTLSLVGLVERRWDPHDDEAFSAEKRSRPPIP